MQVIIPFVAVCKMMVTAIPFITEFDDDETEQVFLFYRFVESWGALRSFSAGNGV